MSLDAQRRSGLILLAVPLAWAAQGLFGWYVASTVCRTTPATAAFPGLGRALIAGATVVALAVSLVALRAALGLRARESATHSLEDERREYLVHATLLVATALSFGLLLAGLPTILVRVCGETR
jgi:hypothetical protein